MIQMKKLGIIMIMVLIFIVPIVSAVDPSYIYIRNEPIDLKIPCTNSTGDFCGASTTCNISVIYPNSSTFISNQAMTRTANYYNYTLPLTDIVGNYQVYAYCIDSAESGFISYSFLVNSTGSAENKLAVIVAFSVLLAFFALFAWALPEEHIILKFIMVSTSLIIAVYVIPTALLIEKLPLTFWGLAPHLVKMILGYAILFLFYTVIMRWINARKNIKG